MSKTKLNDRTLWFDGDSSYNPDDLTKLLSMGNNVQFVEAITPAVIEYNKLYAKSKRISVKTQNKPFNFEWNLPDDFKHLSVYEYIITKFNRVIEQQNLNEQQTNQRALRVAEEFDLYEKHNLFAVLRVLIYIINILEKENVVWGVGRGSSVSSYILYLIGIHDVDSVEYQLDITDFLH